MSHRNIAGVGYCILVSSGFFSLLVCNVYNVQMFDNNIFD